MVQFQALQDKLQVGCVTMSDRPRVLAIGTCRIFRPLRRMDAAGTIEMLHYGKTPHWWFTHTAAEGIQYLRALSGEIDIPAHLRPLVCETTADLPADLAAPDSLNRVDLVVVEISTFKTLEVDGFRLNLQNVWGYANRAGVPPRDALSGKPVDWPEDAQLLADMKMGRAIPEQVEAELLEIHQRVGAPMLTVDHLAATIDGSTPVSGRQDITDALRAIEQRTGIPFHSTRPLIELHGESVALQDANHYHADFEATAGEDLVRSFPRALISA